MFVVEAAAVVAGALGESLTSTLSGRDRFTSDGPPSSEPTPLFASGDRFDATGGVAEDSTLSKEN